MSKYFKAPRDLSTWVKSQESAGSATEILMEVISLYNLSSEHIQGDELDVTEACRGIYDRDDENASNILFKILAQHHLTDIKEEASKMDKQAQTSRERNDWVRGERNKWNRSVDGFNAGTPWRVDRDQIYDFTHYHTDAIRFDEDPNRVYSGEAIWRMYVMDKFYREHKTADGKWVGGYINDRFHVFPFAGTPDNPDVPRDQGNPMGLGLTERTRKPRPHQYSVERRLEVARGNETHDITFTTPVASSFSKIMKTANSISKHRHDDKVYNIFKDCIDMKEAGIQYEEIIGRVSDHYEASISGVAEIAKFADKMIQKHDLIAYELTTANVLNEVDDNPVEDYVDTYTVTRNVKAQLEDGTIVDVEEKTTLVKTDQDSDRYEIVSGTGCGNNISFQDIEEGTLCPCGNQKDADALELNEDLSGFQINDLGV